MHLLAIRAPTRTILGMPLARQLRRSGFTVLEVVSALVVVGLMSAAVLTVGFDMFDSASDTAAAESLAAANAEAQRIALLIDPTDQFWVTAGTEIRDRLNTSLDDAGYSFSSSPSMAPKDISYSSPTPGLLVLAARSDADGACTVAVQVAGQPATWGRDTDPASCSASQVGCLPTGTKGEPSEIDLPC